jgi:hypothetical protein
MAAKHHYEVVVGDESVYRSTYHETSVGKRQAVSTYNEFVKKSKDGIGWASGQDVVLLQDEKPVRKFIGYYGNPSRRKKVRRNPKKPKPYKSTKSFDFWLGKDGEVYRTVKGQAGPVSIGAYSTGIPANARWESSKAHFDKFFDAVYKDNPGVVKGKFVKCKAVKFNRDGSVSIKK